jgi:DNA-binding response OmpR family regulator
MSRSRTTGTAASTSRTTRWFLFLVENHGRMISKRELIKTLWPDSFVDESNLTQQVSMIRRALGESAGQARYVTTVPARAATANHLTRLAAELTATLGPESDNA